MCAVMPAGVLGGQPWNQPSQECVLASRLKCQLARFSEVHRKALTAEHGAFPSADLANIETDVLGERDKVARVHGELFARAELDLLDGTMGDVCESAVARHAKQDETFAGEEGLGPTPFLGLNFQGRARRDEPAGLDDDPIILQLG